ncbi:MAG: response regulator transcription factor [Anaerolineae bacterium]|nr:response regulator transcription factor [Anaerolineae bacterium]
MSKAIVLIGETSSAYLLPLQKHYQVYSARSGKQGIALIQKQQALAVVVDAISLNSTGTRICNAVRRAAPEIALVHILPDSRGKNGKETSPADVIFHGTVGIRALCNSINRFFDSDNPEVLRRGPFEMDIERRILVAHGKEHTLSPKRAALIELFLQNPNQTLDRKKLMQHVWDTDYVGDTRTLSVHIRYVRELMEVDASQPEYIKTVRGIGYRLEISMP